MSRDECQPVSYMTIVKHVEKMTLLVKYSYFFFFLLSIIYRDDVTPTEYNKFQ